MAYGNSKSAVVMVNRVENDPYTTVHCESLYNTRDRTIYGLVEEKRKQKAN